MDLNGRESVISGHSWTLLDALAVVLVSTWVFMILVHLISIIFGKMYLYKYSPTQIVENVPGVSILKPVVGQDANLYRNLQTFFELNYPKYEILFCLQESEDPAIKTIKELIANYPEVNAQLFHAPKVIGVNPKINNMMQGYSVAKHDYIWICDSNIKVHQNTLQEMMSHFKPNVALVHQLPFVTNGSDFAGCLEKVYFGTQHARIYLFANCLGLNCANGMSSLINRVLLEEIGGLKAFSDFIAEDYFICKTLWRKGYKLALSSEPALQNPENRSLQRFKQRMIRWTRLRTTMEPIPALFEPLTESILMGILIALSANHLFGFSIIATFIQHLCLWFALDQLLLIIVQGSSGYLPKFWMRSAAWILRECWTYALFLQAVCGRNIAWRNGYFRISVGGRAKHVLSKVSLTDRPNHVS